MILPLPTSACPRLHGGGLGRDPVDLAASRVDLDVPELLPRLILLGQYWGTHQQHPEQSRKPLPRPHTQHLPCA